ncbi:DUF7351 domain-containing protein [Halorarius halobius]|uniref:DUF7351 domain-containing protein n=1 Tax=Halorarius halobius TaxID=2962671 RepID=UPI0020CC3050|nr:ArsR family transcriptional regulator [Halorarius halobius]
MGDHDNAGGVTVDDLEAAFSLVANDIRFRIVQELWEARQAEALPMPFSELFDSVDVQDSGQFNYHLDKLVPRFVRNVEDGYELTFAGEQVIGAAVSGVYTDTDVTVDGIDVGECTDCGSTIEARYEAGRLDVQCVDCELVVAGGMPAPPVLAASHDPESLPRVFSQFLLTRSQSLTRGFCHHCGGRIESSLDTESWDEPHVQQSCQACGVDVGMAVEAVVLDHPAVVSFLYEEGIDLRETMIWDLDWLFDTEVTVASEEPLRVELTMDGDDERLDLTLDETLSVVDVARS